MGNKTKNICKIHKSHFHSSPLLSEMWRKLKSKTKFKTNYCPLTKRQFSIMDAYFRKNTLNTLGCGLEFFAVFLEEYYTNILPKYGLSGVETKRVVDTFIQMTGEDVTPELLEIGVKWVNTQIHPTINK